MAVPTFDLLSPEFKRDPLPTLARMRACGPVFRTKLPLIGEVWLATTYDSVNDVLRDQKTFVRDAANAGKRYATRFQKWFPRSIQSLSHNMLGHDEPDHRRLRNLVEQAFLRQSVEGMQSRIQALADRFLDQAVAKATGDGRVDLIKYFARPFPLAVICQMLGLPEQDQPQFIRWGRRLGGLSSALSLITALPGVWNLHRYLRRQIEVCRKDPRPGLLSAMVEAEQEGQRLSEDELLAMSFLLLLAGHETTVHLISSCVFALLQAPDQKAKLFANWDLAGTTIEEVLRYMSPVEFTKPRYAGRDIEFSGCNMKRGDFVLPMISAANHDPDQFDKPERFDITRDPNPHLSFGAGIHVCLGLKLARLETKVALHSLFTRFPDLDLCIPATEIPWARRLGMRALTALPITLGAPLKAQAHAIAALSDDGSEGQM